MKIVYAVKAAKFIQNSFCIEEYPTMGEAIARSEYLASSPDCRTPVVFTRFIYCNEAGEEKTISLEIVSMPIQYGNNCILHPEWF